MRIDYQYTTVQYTNIPHINQPIFLKWTKHINDEDLLTILSFFAWHRPHCFLYYLKGQSAIAPTYFRLENQHLQKTRDYQIAIPYLEYPIHKHP